MPVGVVQAYGWEGQERDIIDTCLTHADINLAAKVSAGSKWQHNSEIQNILHFIFPAQQWGSCFQDALSKNKNSLVFESVH